MYGAVQLPRAQGFDGVQSREEPPTLEHLALGPRHPPPGTQPLQQHRREHGVAVLRAFALFDAKRHEFTINIPDLERRHFAGAKACAVGNREGRLVLQVPARADQAHDLLAAQDHGQRARHEHRLHLRH